MAQRQPIRTVFISSTHQDLVEYRAAARDAVLAWESFPSMMEHWPSMDRSAVEMSLARVDESDVFIGIYAHRYGYCPKGSEQSITELEFDRATNNAIPRLCFLLDENLPWSPQHIEGEPGKSRLRKFKDEKINPVLVRRTFTTPEKLEIEILKALRPALDRPKVQFQIGGYRVYDMTTPIPVDNNTFEETLSRAKIVIFLEEEDVDNTRLIQAICSQVGLEASDIRLMQRATGSTVVQLELPSQSANDFHQQVFANVPSDTNIGLVVTRRSTNVTELLKQVEQLTRENKRLEELSKLQRDIPAILLHDLRAPLAAITGYAEMLGIIDPLSDKQQHFLERLKQSIVRIQALIDDVMTLAAVETNNQLDREQVDINEITKEAIASLQLTAEQAEIDIRFAPTSQPIKITANKRRLLQVITNLVTNAIKYSSRLSHVDIATQYNQLTRMVEFSVTDFGIGIRPEDQSLVFERFYRSKGTEKIAGSGLGLAIVKSVVESYGGTVSVKSQIGKGSTFTIRVPASLAQTE